MEEMRDDEQLRSAYPRDAGTRGEGERSESDRNIVEDEQEEVRRRAYERYLARGDSPGDEMEDWLTAEREYRSSREQNAPQSSGRGRSRRGGSDGGSGRDGGTG
jgi:hypothetical protein